MSAPVPETLLKSNKSSALRHQHRKTRLAKLSQKRENLKTLSYKRAEQYSIEYQTADIEKINARRTAKNEGKFYIEEEPKIAFVMRIRGINKISPRVKKILQLLRLRQIHNGVFVRLSTPILKMLHIIEPYIAYGYPNLKTVREIIYKRGYAKIDGQRIPITDNSVIEKHLGKYGIVCIEDLVHEIYTSGPKFREASRFLWPFKLSSPNGGYTSKLHSYLDGGDSGNRESAINPLLRRMN